MNLLVICHGFPPYYGGAEHAAYYLAREAARAGMKVCVLTSDIGGRLPRAETLDGLLPARRGGDAVAQFLEDCLPRGQAHGVVVDQQDVGGRRVGG